MAASLRFDGRVALVTGAGRGLGRSYALLLASRGAHVIVNDMGGDVHGNTAQSSPAESVAAEILALGGQAIAVSEPVEHGDKTVDIAMARYGRLDIVINNAGIIRDHTFRKMTDEDWKAVQNVHLWGAYKVTRAAWPHLIERGYGRIVMTTSASGLYGNIGQANYSAAKMALVGLTSTLAKEGDRYNIRVNSVSPSASSRMTEAVIASELKPMLRADLISPLVAWLSHESCPSNGETYEAAGGWVGQARIQRSRGVAFSPDTGYTPEDLAARWSEVRDFSRGSSSPHTPEDIVEPVLRNMKDLRDDAT